MTGRGPGLLETPTARIEWRSYGAGEPCTLFAHGLAGSIEATRPFASGVPGRRVFLHFRGHGASRAVPGPWSYADLAADLLAVADHVAATRALGVSMGAGAICAALAQAPARFERLVLAVPAVLDIPRDPGRRGHFARLADLLEAGDADAVAEALASRSGAVPGETGPASGIGRWARDEAAGLLAARPGILTALREFPSLAALSDRGALAAVTAPTLVVAVEDDPVHPVATARELAAALPDARLTVLPPGGLLWSHRARLRALVGEFLGA